MSAPGKMSRPPNAMLRSILLARSTGITRFHARTAAIGKCLERYAVSLYDRSKRTLA
jgi:ribosomal protein S12 methylthiotransferase accessory factor YcaO